MNEDAKTKTPDEIVAKLKAAGYLSFKGPKGASPDEAERGFDACAFYDCDDESEELSYSSPDEAIEMHLDALDSLPAAGETVTVYGWTRIPVGVNAEQVLERVLEDLDEEHGNPNVDGNTEPTPKMREAAYVFARAIEAEYESWMCDQTHSAEVDVATWVRENAPHWLEGEHADKG